MKDALLLFLSSMLILFVGLYFGYFQIKGPYEISESLKSLSQSFEGEIDQEFLKSLRPAYE